KRFVHLLQWFSTWGPQMFLAYNSQKSQPITNKQECEREGGFCVFPIGGSCRFPFAPIGKCSTWTLCCKK
uniref:Beta/alpha-defensin C-terminal domain-containing protein n=1 Tax=Anolis carolinensis TaxID=28377 RepID=A0A803TET9_ANOCA